MNKKIPLVALGLGSALVACLISSVVRPPVVRASDHDDGESEIKARNLNLTDLYVFRESDQVPNTDPNASASNLIMIMDLNPRSIARQQYFFNTQALYDLNITRVSNKDVAPTGKANITLRFTFAAPDTNNQQAITVTSIVDGTSTAVSTTTGGSTIKTTSLAGGASEVNNTISLTGASGTASNLTVFAGAREDPFFFDVDQFFRVRASAAAIAGGSTQAQVLFRPAGQAIDSFMGYNVLSVVVRVPIAFLQKAGETTFDTWEIVSVPQPIKVQALRK